jgi:ligand-binding sensor domain-containing protein
VAWIQAAKESAVGRDIREEYLHRMWTREQGLPDNRVHAVAQSRDGYLWLGTGEGLARFDGAQFTVFNRANTPEMVSEACRSVIVDATDVLWVGTDAGLLRRTAKGLRGFTLLPAAEAAHLQLLAKGRQEGVWAKSLVSTFLYHLASDRVLGSYRIDSPDSPFITDVHELSDGRVWVGRSDGVFRLDPGSGRWERPTPELPQAAPWSHAVAFDVSGFYDLVGGWPREVAHLYRVADGAWKLTSTNLVSNDSRPLFLSADNQGDLWMPIAGGGLGRLSKGRWASLRVPSEEEEEFVICAQEDRDGALWLGTENGGVHRIRPRRIQMLTTAEGLASENPECVIESRDGSMWIGADNGLSRLTTNGFTTFREPEGLSRSIVRSLAEDNNGVIWIGTLSGLNYFKDGRIQQFSLPGDWAEGKVRTLLTTRDGALWVGTVRGLSRITSGETNKWTMTEGLSRNEVLALLEDPMGHGVWVGTAGGGVNYLGWGSAFGGASFSARVRRSVSTTNGLSSDYVRTLHQDRDSVLWIGTDKGLNRYDSDGRCTAFDTRHGLPDNQITELLEDDFGRFWIGFDRGLYRVDRQALNDVAAGRAATASTVAYDTVDGLPSQEINGKLSQPASFKSRDGRLWFATARGIAIFNPRDLPDNLTPPELAIEQVRANGRIVYDNGPLGMVTAVHLPAGTARILEIQFTATTFNAPEKTRFKYRLEGLDTDWIDAGNARKAYYANLHPGAYSFRVIAANKHGVWNHAGATLAFDLAPYLHQRRWFPWLCSALAGLGIYSAVRWRLGEIRKLHRLEQRIALDQQRSRIARDIHDELGASLTQIAQLSAEVSGGDQADAPTRRIATLAEEAIGNIGEIVWANNPRYDSLQDLVAFLREYAAEYLGGVSLACTLDFPNDVPMRGVPGPFRRHLLAILKEALHNVVKHSGASHVELTLRLDNGRLRLDLRDNGCGMKEREGRDFGNGLPNIRERVAELRGRFDLRSTTQAGTSLRVDVPLPP